MAPAAEGSTHTLELGHGLELRCTIGGLDGAVEVAIGHGSHVPFRETFTPGKPTAGFNVDLEVVRADGSVNLDVFTGELSWAGHLSARFPGGRWHEIFDVDHHHLMSFEPGVGSIGGSPEVFEPVVDDPGYGRSQLCTPSILRIFVDDERREIADAGRIVKARMFADHPPFVFNTVCCVGEVADGTPGVYPDPTSIWFNVFFGFYQLDCAKSEWSRPFGYRSAAGAASEVEPGDIVRLGKSDWNWFSNFLYGVPTEFVEPYSSPDMAGVEVEETPPQRIGSTLWHGVTLRGVECASTYQSATSGAARLTTNTKIDDIWRNAFGLPGTASHEDWPDSFVPTRLIAQVDMAYWEDEDAFHTMIFGGTAAVDAPSDFLAAQVAATRKVIESAYPDRGFASA